MDRIDLSADQLAALRSILARHIPGREVRAMASRRSRVPKGVFRYRTMAEANADWERWHVELVVETNATSGIKTRR